MIKLIILPSFGFLIYGSSNIGLVLIHTLMNFYKLPSYTDREFNKFSSSHSSLLWCNLKELIKLNIKVSHDKLLIFLV
nr:MAG TPA: hypothetical protein [Caudoviricetes sp.]